MHAALEDLYGRETALADNGGGKAGRKPEIAFKDFLKAAKTVFKRKGYDPGMLDQPEVVNLIKATHAVYKDAIDTGVADNDIPEAMMRKLDHDAFMFSGFKVHHELSEVSLSLRDDKGRVKGYDAFAHDVRKIHDTYNGAYLRAEYDFAVTSSQMAAKWRDVEAGKGRYDLQYRTAGDGRVREEHAAMHGITLPADDPFWDKYYPPNGWRCRCTAVEVNKGKYPVSDSEEAKRIGDKATTKLDRFGNNKAGIFRFNPGKEGKVFPPKHPYLPKGCEGCTRGMGNLSYNPDSEKCRACTGIKKVWDDDQAKTLDKKLQAINKASGGELIQTLREIVDMPNFKPVDGHISVRSAIDSKSPDYDNLLSASDKAVRHGYNVAILPNPKGFRTPDVILYNRKFIAAYDVKTISGQNSVGNRLNESIGQTKRVILNMATDYNPRSLAKDIQGYFQSYKDAQEVKIFKGGSMIEVRRSWIKEKGFLADFIRQFSKNK